MNIYETLNDEYMYIYIYCNPQKYCFVVSQFFSVTRHVERFMLGLKPAQLYVGLSIIPFSHHSKYVSSGFIRHYVVAFVCLHFTLPDTRVFNSRAFLFHEWQPSVARAGSSNEIVLCIGKTCYSCSDLKKRNTFKSIFQKISAYTKVKVTEEDLY